MINNKLKEVNQDINDIFNLCIIDESKIFDNDIRVVTYNLGECVEIIDHVLRYHKEIVCLSDIWHSESQEVTLIFSLK